jgi:hypothetical protein
MKGEGNFALGNGEMQFVPMEWYKGRSKVFSVPCGVRALCISAVVLACLLFFVLAIPSKNANKLPLAVIDLYSSKATLNRVSAVSIPWLYDSPFRANGTFEFRIVISDLVPGPFPLKHQYVNCSDEHNGPNALPCRVEKGYATFVKAYPNSGWLLRADDDVWINLSLLYHYILKLNKMYDPMKHLVFRTHANPERAGKFYAHGGCGWLVSNAYVKYHVTNDVSLIKLLPYSRYRQDDTAQSIIIRHMFPKVGLWDEPTIMGYTCLTCNQFAFTNWSLLPVCPSDKYGIRISDLMVLHGCSGSAGIQRLIRAIPTAPVGIMIYRDQTTQRALLCRDAFLAQMYTFGNARDELLVEGKDLPHPLIDYTTLHDDHLDK